MAVWGVGGVRRCNGNEALHNKSEKGEEGIRARVKFDEEAAVPSLQSRRIGTKIP